MTTKEHTMTQENTLIWPALEAAIAAARDEAAWETAWAEAAAQD